MAIDSDVERYAFLRLLPPPSGTIDTRNERGLLLRLFPNPATTAAANSPIAAYVEAFRNLYLTSTEFLAWIQSVDSSETATGHVHLGWRPQDLRDPAANGPVVLLRWENFRAVNAGSAHTFAATVDVVADHVWATGADARSSDTFIEEMGFIDQILNEMVGKIGITLDGTFGGHLVRLDAADSLQQDPHDETLWHSEVRYTIGFGMQEG